VTLGASYRLGQGPLRVAFDAKYFRVSTDSIARFADGSESEPSEFTLGRFQAGLGLAIRF